MSERNMRVVASGVERDAHLALICLADDSVDQVRAYHQTGTLYALDDAAGSGRDLHDDAFEMALSVLNGSPAGCPGADRTVWPGEAFRRAHAPEKPAAFSARRAR